MNDCFKVYENNIKYTLSTRPYNQEDIGLMDVNTLNEQLEFIIDKLSFFPKDSSEYKYYQARYVSLVRLIDSIDVARDEYRDNLRSNDAHFVDIEDFSPLNKAIAIKTQRGHYEGRITDLEFETAIANIRREDIKLC